MRPEDCREYEHLKRFPSVYDVTCRTWLLDAATHMHPSAVSLLPKAFTEHDNLSHLFIIERICLENSEKPKSAETLIIVVPVIAVFALIARPYI